MIRPHQLIFTTGSVLLYMSVLSFGQAKHWQLIFSHKWIPQSYLVKAIAHQSLASRLVSLHTVYIQTYVLDLLKCRFMIDSNIISIYYRYNNGMPFVITSELGICFVVLSYIYSSPLTNQINANVDLEKLKCRVHSTCLKHVNLNIAGTYRKAALQPKTIFFFASAEYIRLERNVTLHVYIANLGCPCWSCPKCNLGSDSFWEGLTLAGISLHLLISAF